MIRKTILIFTLSLSQFSCVERYFIDGAGNESSKIVIEGTIVDLCEAQEIVISHSSSTDYPDFLPYSGCNVSVVDGNGNEFLFTENLLNSGHYQCSIDEKYLIVGNKFKLVVKTPANQQYESPYEEMMPCANIDSLYFEIQRKPTADPDKTLDGIQFYLDFVASDYFSRYYRWQIDESYEYHSFWPIKNYINEYNQYVSSNGPPSYSKFVCFKTETIDDIITLSTKALSKNMFKGFRLNFVDDHTQRLKYNYSILVKQYSLDEDACIYWEKINKNNKSGAGLFTKQPEQIVGNIVNINNDAEKVLGYFGASSVNTKRIVVDVANEFAFRDINGCKLGFLKYGPLPLEPRPIYFAYDTDPADGTWSLGWSYAECFDCTSLGGSLDKPDFFK